MKKIGILTWWRNNYGSTLQAYAMQKKIEEFPDYKSEIICQYGKKVASISNMIDKIKRFGIKTTFKRVIWKFGLKKLRMRSFKNQKFIDDNLKVSNIEYNEKNISEANKKYDIFLCGSDQIWNPKLVELDSIYWLNFVESGKKKISYAPSFGVDSVSKIESHQIKNNLLSFNYISSREESGTKILNKIINDNRCVTVLDPTLLVERKIWDELSTNTIYNEDYLFVYLLRGTRKQRKIIENIAKNKKLKIVTMPFLDNEKINLYDFKFGDIKCWDADPAEFISIIKNAKYVITDSYHCMLFSTMYHVEFLTFEKIGKAQLNRVLGFQKMIDVQGRMINENVTFEYINNLKKINWSKVDKIISEKRRESNEFLEKALNEG